jgi:hypothetical protein
MKLRAILTESCLQIQVIKNVWFLRNHKNMVRVQFLKINPGLNLKLIGGAIAGPFSLSLSLSAAGIVTSAGDLFDPTKQVRLL